MAKWRTPDAPPISGDEPPELSDHNAEPWRTPDSTRLWLEAHGLRRRMRPIDDLVSKTRNSRRMLARDLWLRRPGGRDEWMNGVTVEDET